MALYNFFKFSHESLGIQYGLRIFLGTGFLWFALKNLDGFDPLWAVISLIIVTEQNMKIALLGFKSRIINTIVGCFTGLLFLLFIHHNNLIMLPAALMAAVCISTYLIRSQYGWRIAAITTAIIIIPSLAEDSRTVGMIVALQRAIEVFLGSITAVIVTWLFTIVPKIVIRRAKDMNRVAL